METYFNGGSAALRQKRSLLATQHDVYGKQGGKIKQKKPTWDTCHWWIVTYDANQMESSFFFHSNFNIVITIQFCTCHDSCAVMACAKNCSDLFSEAAMQETLYLWNFLVRCKPHEPDWHCLNRVLGRQPGCKVGLVNMPWTELGPKHTNSNPLLACSDTV